MSGVFRQGIVAVLRDARGRVLLGERSDHPGSWQFPQGGVEPGETHEDAFFRELREELGNGSCRILRGGDRPVRYRWPEPGRDGVHGQEQRWFLGEFLEGETPRLDESDHCFRDWRWAGLEEALRLVVSWKRPAYVEGLRSLGLSAE
jgi:putative (di)nucleoside polyphosphate hydrolase